MSALSHLSTKLGNSIEFRVPNSVINSAVEPMRLLSFNLEEFATQEVFKDGSSALLGKPAPKAAPAIDIIKPLTPETQRTSHEFYSVLDFVLQFCPTVPSERELMARFAKIGVGAGKTFDASKLSPETKKAIEGGIADAWAEFQDLVGRVNKGEVSSGDVFGTREYLKNNYLYRMGAAVLGIYGNDKEEAIYPVFLWTETSKSWTAVTAIRCVLRKASCHPSTRSGH